MGVEDQTLEKSLNKIRIFFLWTGLKLHNLTNPSQKFYFFNVIWLHSDLFCSTGFTFKSLSSGSNSLEVLFLGPCLAFTYLGDIKALSYKIMSSEVYQLIDDLMKLETRSSTNLEMEKKIRDVEISFLNKVINVTNGLTGFMIFVFNVGPLPLIALTYYSTGEVELFLPFQNVYPFNALNIYCWPFAYIHQIWTVIVALFYASAMDCVLFICCTYLRIHFLLIQTDIKNIIPAAPLSRKFKGDLRFQTKLKDVLNRHQEAIRLSNALENVFKRTILVNFMTSSIIICLSGFNVTKLEDITLAFTFIIFLFMVLSQVWCLCYFGELLMNSSEEVSDAVYESLWYLSSKDISMQLLFLQTRAQNPCKLTASGFADLKLSAFMQILSKAWSYFALLNTMYGR